MYYPAVINKFGWPCVFGLFLLLAMIPISSLAQSGQNDTIHHAAIQNKPGLHMEYEAWTIVSAYHPMIREDYSIDILETWKGGVSFRYTTKESLVMTSQTGIQTLTSLDDCKTLDPWWEPGKTEYDNRCELWISKRVFNELLVEQKAYLNVDSSGRADSVVAWQFKEYTHYPCEIEGKVVLLKAIKVTTTRHDEIVILNDPDNPLILSIRSSHFQWDIVRIRYQ